LLIIYSLPCHPRCPCLSFFSRKEIKVFDENIGFSPYSMGIWAIWRFLHIQSPYSMGLQWEANGSRSKRQLQCKLQTGQRALNDSRRIRVFSSETITQLKKK